MRDLLGMQAPRLQAQQTGQREPEPGKPDAPVQTVAAPADSGTAAGAATGRAAGSGARVTLGHINALLAPVKLDAAGLAELGFEPVAKDKSAKLYNEDDIPDMCRAIAEHVTEIAALQAA